MVSYHPHPPDTAFTAIPHLLERDAVVVSDAGFMWKAVKGRFCVSESTEALKQLGTRLSKAGSVILYVFLGNSVSLYLPLFPRRSHEGVGLELDAF